MSTYFDDYEWRFQSELGLTSMMSNIAGEYTHIMEHGQKGGPAITVNFTNSDTLWGKVAWGNHGWSNNYGTNFGRLNDDSINVATAITNLQNTIAGHQSRYSPGMPGFYGYDFAYEGFGRPIRTPQQETNFCEALDAGIQAVRQQDALSEIVLSMSFADMFKDEDWYDSEYQAPYSDLQPYPPFVVGEDGAGWSKFVDFDYTLLSPFFFVDQYGSEQAAYRSYNGPTYERILHLKLYRWILGSRLIHQYADDFRTAGLPGPEPIWVEAIQAQRYFRPWYYGYINGYYEYHWKEYLRRPTRWEVRNQAFLAIACGAKGIEFWPYKSSYGDTTELFLIIPGNLDKMDEGFEKFLDEEGETKLPVMDAVLDGQVGSPPTWYPKVSITHGLIDYRHHPDDVGVTDRNEYRAPLNSNDQDWADPLHSPYESTPYTFIQDLYSDLKNLLPILDNLDWVWTISDDQIQDSTTYYGANTFDLDDQLYLVPDHSGYTSTLISYFSISAIQGCEEEVVTQSWTQGTLTHQYKDAVIGLFRDPRDPDSEYYLIVNSFRNDFDGSNVDPADPAVIQLEFTSKDDGSYRLYDVLNSNTSLNYWTNVSEDDVITSTNISVPVDNPRLLRLVHTSALHETSSNNTTYWGNSDGSPSTLRKSANVYVTSNNHLVIYPGTTVEFSNNNTICVYNGGTLTIQGTENAPIILRASSASILDAVDPRDCWNGIRYYSTAPSPSEIDWVEVQNASPGIRIDDLPVTMHNVSFVDCGSPFLLNNSDGCFLYDVTVSNCTNGIEINDPDSFGYIGNYNASDINQYGLSITNSACEFLISGVSISRAGQHGIHIINQISNKITIEDAELLYNGFDQSSLYCGIYVSGSNNVSLDISSVDRNMSAGLYALSNSNVTINGVQFAENGTNQSSSVFQPEIIISTTSYLDNTSTSYTSEIYDQTYKSQGGSSTYLVINTSSLTSNIGKVFWQDSRYSGNDPNPTRINGLNKFITSNQSSASAPPSGYFLSDFPTTPEARLSLASTYSDSGRYTEALQMLNALIEENYDAVIVAPAISLLASIQFRQGSTVNQIVTLLQGYEEEIENTTTIRQCRKLQASYLSSAGYYDDAADILEQLALSADLPTDSIECLIDREKILRLETISDNDTEPNDGKQNAEEMRKLAVKKHDTTIHDLMEQLISEYDVNTRDELPTAYELGNGYPNPFNASIIIPYRLPKNSTVKIEIFNILGRKLISLVNSRQLAGSHSTIWNPGSSLHSIASSGVYFVRMEASGYTKTRKIVLMK